MKLRTVSRWLYLSSFGIIISLALNLLAFFTRPFMVYGYFNRSPWSYRRSTRISSTATLIDREKIQMGDNVWIWHHSVIDGSGGVVIKEGVQIGIWVGIFTHSSHVSVRLYGREYLSTDRDDRKGYRKGSVEIGEYCFIGAGACLMPGVRLGKGCVVAAGAIVNKSAPDYSILAGAPAEIVGNTFDLDKKHLVDPELRRTYFDQARVKEWSDQ